MAEQDIREQIAKKLYEIHNPRMFSTFEELGDRYWNSAEGIRETADQILNIKCSRERVCPECKGKGTKVSWNMIDCPTCKGTGSLVETKEVREIIKEWEDG